MQSFFLMIARFSLAAWVGAASLFVITSVQEAQSPEFDSVTRSTLALLRFPTYYAFGFSLVAAALFSGINAARHSAIGRGRIVLFLLLVVTALLTMTVDYIWIYRPLESMIAQPTQSRPASFVTYHETSKYINFAHVGICFLAALVLCWPGCKKES